MSIIFGLFWILLFGQSVMVAADENEGVLEKIKNGIKYSQNYLDTAKEIADLVSQSLGHKVHKPKGDQNKEFNKPPEQLDSGNVASAFFRLLGLDSTRIAAIAVNSAIFLAHMISSLFNIQTEPKNIPNAQARQQKFNPLEFLMNTKNEKLNKLLTQAQNPELPKQLIDQLDGLDSECIRLLLCKASPVISAIQGSLNNRYVSKRRSLTSWLPKREVFEKNSDACEERHYDCNVFPEMEKNPKEW